MNPRSTIYTASLLALLLLGGSPWASGQRSRRDVLTEREFTIWFPTGNSAALADNPLPQYNLVDFGWDRSSGQWHPYQQGESERDLLFSTDGALRTGKMFLWGSFSYTNNYARDTKYNTILSDPFDDRFLYAVADTVASSWKRQTYDMSFKAALPLGKAVNAGLEVRYADKISAKQNDPRAESFNYNLQAVPSLLFKAGNLRLGLNGTYERTFERSSPTLSNGSEVQKVYITRGLGNYLEDAVGSSGLGIMYYRCNSFGGGVQAGWKDSFLLEAAMRVHKTDISESPTQPRDYGHTLQYEGHILAQWLMDENDKLSLKARGTQTLGREVTSLWDTPSGEWVVRNELDQCRYDSYDASLEYTRLFPRNKGRLTIAALYDETAREYALPLARFNYRNAGISAGYGQRIGIGRSALELDAEASYTKNLSGEYSYTGHRGNGPLVRDFYPHELGIFTADVMGAALKGAWSTPLKKGMVLSLGADYRFFSAGGRDLRHRTAATVSLVF